MKKEFEFLVTITTVNRENVRFYLSELIDLEEKIETHKIKKSEIENIHMSRVIPELIKQPKIKSEKEIKSKKESIIQQWSRIINPKD